MHDPLPVRRVEGVRDLRSRSASTCVSGSAPLHEAARERLALEELHDEVARSRRASPTSKSAQMLRVGELRDRLAPRARSAASSPRTWSRIGRQDLDRRRRARAACRAPCRPRPSRRRRAARGSRRVRGGCRRRASRQRPSSASPVQDDRRRGHRLAPERGDGEEALAVGGREEAVAGDRHVEPSLEQRLRSAGGEDGFRSGRRRPSPSGRDAR